MGRVAPRALRAIKDLTLDDRNANKGTERGREALAHSLKVYGAGRSILADRRGRVIAGNQTLRKAAELGLAVRVVETDGKELVVVQRRDLDLKRDKAARELAIADNRVQELDLEWDDEVLKALVAEGVNLEAFFGKDELAELLGTSADGCSGEDASVDAEKADELRRKWDVKRGQVWLIESRSALGKRHRILCGDSTSAEDVARVMSAKADCVFTSPPYGVGIDYGPSYEDTVASLRTMLPGLAATWLRDVVVPGGFAVINFGDVVSGRSVVGTKEPCEYPMAIEYWPIFRAAGWLLWSRRIWCKPNARVAAPWCASSNRAASDWEHVWTWKVPGTPIVGRMPESQMGWIDTTHESGVDVGKEVHGAGMALSIAERAIAVHSRDGAIVHEPFTGTGTTLVAAENVGRICYGIEIEPRYVAVTLERLALLGLAPAIEGKR